MSVLQIPLYSSLVTVYKDQRLRERKDVKRFKQTSNDLKWHSKWLKRPTMPLKKYTVHFNRMIESIVPLLTSAPVHL